MPIEDEFGHRKAEGESERVVRRAGTGARYPKVRRTKELGGEQRSSALQRDPRVVSADAVYAGEHGNRHPVGSNREQTGSKDVGTRRKVQLRKNDVLVLAMLQVYEGRPEDGARRAN